MNFPFLKNVIADVLNAYKTQTEHLVFVLPGKRATLFMRKYYAELLPKVGLAPQFITIEELLLQISQMQKTQPLELLFDLYETYLSNCKTSPDDFETFSGWGPTLLKDFNEIDQYLINPDKIFPYIHAIKEAEHWSGADELTQIQRKHLEFWNTLGNYYFAFQKKMLKKASGYAGMIAKQAINLLPNYIKKNQDSIFIFAGFNALSECEQRIIQTLLSQTKAEIYWDIDRYFVERKEHDAGLFIRKYLKKWSYYHNRTPKWIGNYYSNEKTIHILGLPKNTSQAHQISQLISQTPKEKLSQTALILSDEQLLIPVLQSIDVDKPINITMGYPLKQTPMSDFFSVFFRLHLSKKFYYKDIVQLLTNPILQKMVAENTTEQIVNEIHKRNLNYLSRNTLLELAPTEYIEFFNELLPNTEDKPIDTLIEHALKFIIHFKKVADQNREKYGLWIECAYRFHQLFLQLKHLQNQYGYIQSVRTLYHFYLNILQKESLDFVGEPLEGIQLMGVLESRNLDFENIIIASVNEGILPAGKSDNSFIPYDVKCNLGLPTYKERDAIFCYHFYRLLQRSKTAHLLYNTDTDGLKGQEKSRFLLQLLTEKIPTHHINHQIIVPEVLPIQEHTIRIEKDEHIMNKLKELATSGFSPSALTTYIFSPIAFYKQYVLGIKEDDDVEENIEVKTFGNIIHHTLEELYQPQIGNVLLPKHINQMKEQTPPIVKKYFEKEYKSNQLKGKNLLAYKVILEYITRFLNMEKETVEKGTEIIVQQLERKLFAPLENHHLKHPINLKGYIDRIDIRNGIPHIIDYKTGIVENNQVTINDWGNLITDFKYSKAYQLLTYAYLFKKTNPSVEAVMAGNFSFKRLKNGLQLFGFKSAKDEKNEYITNVLLAEYEIITSQLLDEIFNKSIPFEERR